MGRSLPQEWIDGTLHTLNVVRDLGGKGNIPHTSLSVVRQKPSANSRKTKNLQWRFLPPGCSNQPYLQGWLGGVIASCKLLAVKKTVSATRSRNMAVI